MSVDGSNSKASSVSMEEEDLPPGVRKHNRCHNSSSESEEEPDQKKVTKDADSSDSDSGHSMNGTGKTNTVNDSKGDDVKKSPSKDIGSKGKRSRSNSSLDSRSRSRSTSPKRRSRHSRSRSRDRRHKKDRKHRYRSRSKERRCSKDRHRHKKDRRRSRSRSRDRRDRRHDRRSSRERRRRSRSRSRSKRSRSRDRRRDSRSPTPRDGKVIKFGDKVIKPGASFGRPASSSSSSHLKPVTFKEKMRQELIKAIADGGDTDNTDILANKGSKICTQSAGVLQAPPKPKGPPLPLMEQVITAGALPAMTVTASEAAMQSMLALQKQATEKTGIEIPKYYNPAAINPMKYAEQVQKRKLLWSKAKDKDVNSQWHATSLSGDADDKSKEKFRKLMGIKEASAAVGCSSSVGQPVEGGEQGEKQKQLFDQLNKEYEFARMTTHTHRGLGLGFTSAASVYQQQAPPQPPPPPT